MLDPMSADAAAATATAATTGEASRSRPRNFKQRVKQQRDDLFDIAARGLRIIVTIAVGTVIYLTVDAVSRVVTSDAWGNLIR